MADVIGKYDAACTLMHNRNNTVYKDFVTEVVEDLTTSVNMALAAGVSQDKILIDPGIGFGKTYEQNLQMMKELERLQEIGYPILLGTSKKSIIGLTLNIGTDERVEGTIATTVIGYMKGCRIFRVHNVKENLRALRMTEAIMQA
jgi:dihydropteroate synthase